MPTATHVDLQQVVSDSLKLVSPDARRLYSHLGSACHGAARAQTCEQISKLLRIPQRAINDLVHELRRAGLPVAASFRAPFGYFLPATRAEAEDTARSLHDRAIAVLGAEKGFKRGCELWFGQATLFEADRGA